MPFQDKGTKEPWTHLIIPAGLPDFCPYIQDSTIEELLPLSTLLEMGLVLTSWVEAEIVSAEMQEVDSGFLKFDWACGII